MPRMPCVLAVPRVRERLAELGLTQDELAARCAVSPRTVANWLAGRGLGVEAAEDLAQALGLGLAEVLEAVPDGTRWQVGEADLWRMGRGIRDPLLSGTFFAWWHGFAPYLRHVALRPWPLRGRVRRLQGGSARRNFYAQVRVQPAAPPRAASAPARFVFSYVLGTLVLIDYGEIVVHGGQATLTPYWPVQTGNAAIERVRVPVGADGAFRVLTWIGDRAPRLRVRSDAEFSVALDEGEGLPDPDDPAQGGFLCFRAAPHHLELAGRPA